MRDLDDFLEEWTKLETELNKADAASLKGTKGGGKQKKKAASKSKKKAHNDNDEDDESADSDSDEGSDFEEVMPKKPAAKRAPVAKKVVMAPVVEQSHIVELSDDEPQQVVTIPSSDIKPIAKLAPLIVKTIPAVTSTAAKKPSVLKKAVKKALSVTSEDDEFQMLMNETENVKPKVQVKTAAAAKKSAVLAAAKSVKPAAKKSK